MLTKRGFGYIGLKTPPAVASQLDLLVKDHLDEMSDIVGEGGGDD